MTLAQHTGSNERPERGDVEEGLGDLVDDPAFQRIVRHRSRFNLFEAVGAIRGELRHSNFLGFLLSPARNHGLGSLALARVLRAILARMPPEERPLTGLELIVGDLSGTVVDRELHNIDLLIEIRSLNLLVVIENKIDAKAGDGQLGRYKAIVERRYPQHRRLLVFLTPAGTPPDEPGYVAFSYSDLAKVLEAIVVEAGSETALVMTHYLEMLRRHIVPDENLRILARQLYERHREAFDFIADCKPEAAGMIDLVREAYEANAPSLVRDNDTGSMLRFVPAEWADVPALNTCPPQEWTKTGRTLLFEIKTYGHRNDAGRVNVALVVGPAEPHLRARLYEGARARPDVFVGLVKPMGAKFTTIFARDLLSGTAGKDLSMDERALVVNDSWSDFLGSSLPLLKSAVAEILSAGAEA